MQTAVLVATVLAALVVWALLPLGATGVSRLGQLLLLGLVAGQFAYSVPWPDALPPRVATVWVLAAAGGVARFTGRDSAFEEPPPGAADLVLDTTESTPAESLAALVAFAVPRIAAP